MTDLRYALRLLARQPGFAALSIVALGLGIGATTAIFSVVNGVLLKPLPFPDPDRLVVIWRAVPQESEGNHSAADFLDIQRRNRTFAHVAGYREEILDLSGEAGDPERLAGAQVTPAFFDALGIRPAAGRLFGAVQDRPGAGRRAVISEGLWERRFGRDPSVIGRTLRLNDRPFTVLGVVPRGAGWPEPADIWALSERDVPAPPLDVAGELVENRDVHYFNIIGRLQPGVSLERGNQDLDRIASAIRQQTGGRGEAATFRVERLHDELVAQVRPALYLLLGSVAFVLLVACANVAGLLLARASVRRGELAVRGALGAGRGRIVRQLLVESAVLAFAACAAGLVFAAWGIRALLALAPQDIPRLTGIALDVPVFAFTVLLACASVALFGLVPALLSSRGVLSTVLKQSGGPSARSTRSAARGALVVCEIAVAVVLLAGAGLTLASLARLLRVDPGFSAAEVVAVPLPLPELRYPPARQVQFYRELLDGLRQRPETGDAVLGFPNLLGGTGGSATVLVDGRAAPPPEDRPRAALNLVSPGFFQTLGIPLLQGRAFDNREVAGEPSAVVVNAALVRRLLPGEDPIGRRLLIGGEDAMPVPIVGVVADVRWTSFEDEPEPAVYLSFAQFPLPYLTVFVRGGERPAAIAAAVRAQVAAMDGSLAVEPLETLSQIVARRASQPRFRATLLAAFAAVALLLAAIGVYGIVSQSVAQRVREIGVRQAFGATPRHVVGMVLAEGMRLALIGVGVGLAAALVLARTAESLLFGVTAADPLTFAVVTVLLVGVSAFAAWVPARRAMKVDPVVALRAE